MALTTHQQLLDALTQGRVQYLWFRKASCFGTVRTWTSVWTIGGSPGGGSNPSPALEGQVPTKDTAGAFPISNPSGGNTLYMFSFGIEATTRANCLMVYDRIWHVGGVGLNTTDAQAITGVTAPTRYSSGIGNLIAIEVTTNGGGTPAIMTVSYTNTADQSGRSATVALPASIPGRRVCYLNLQAGDAGVKSIQSVSLSEAMGAGVANLFMLNSAALFPVSCIADQIVERDTLLQSTVLPIVQPDACLALLSLMNSDQTDNVSGKLTLVEG